MTQPGDQHYGDWIYQLYLTDPSVSHLTEEVVRKALSGFPVEPQKEYSWLATACQAALHKGFRAAGYQAERKGNSEVRDELQAIADRMKRLWLDLHELSSEADSGLWDYAFRSWVRKDGDQGQLIGESTEFQLLSKTRDHLFWAGKFFMAASKHVGEKVQPPKWAQAEKRDLRIMLARHLAVVFETAYCMNATPKNGGSNDTPASFGHWADFMCRILYAAGIKEAGHNLGDVLKVVRKLHLSEPVLFEPGMIPE